VTKDLTASVTGYNVSAGEAAGGVADDPILAIADVGCLEHDVSLGPFSDLINNLLSGECVCGLPVQDCGFTHKLKVLRHKAKVGTP
jgi:hypothetical protein